MLTRRKFMASCAAGIAWAGAGPLLRGAEPAGAGRRRPNVVVTLIDDLGYGDIGAYGCPDIPTPNIDSLARDGVRCTNGYSLCPVCSPSRAGLQAGLYPQRFQVNGNNDRGVALPADHPPIAQFMREAGYRTGFVGRWDLGDARQGALEIGYQEAARKAKKPADRKHPSYLGDDGTYWTEVQGDYLADFVERHQKEPFFLYFAPLAVHSPVDEAPAACLKRVPNSVQGPRRGLAGTLIALDDTIGKLLNKLQACGLDEDTLIFFVGDNGGDLKSGARMAPLRGGKATPWDGAVREPYLVRWKGRLPAGKDYAGLVSTLDIYATAAAAADKAAPARLDGVNLLPYLTGEKQGDPHPALFWRWIEDKPNLRAIRSGKWRLMLEKKQRLLFDLAADPGETLDLAAKQPAVVKDLESQYLKWEESLPPVRAPQTPLASWAPFEGRGWATEKDRGAAPRKDFQGGL
jgi:arylsulfatase A-like enzyme